MNNSISILSMLIAEVLNSTDIVDLNFSHGDLTRFGMVSTDSSDHLNDRLFQKNTLILLECILIQEVSKKKVVNMLISTTPTQRETNQ